MKRNNQARPAPNSQLKGILTSLITLLTLTGMQAQPSASTPKLVVGLTIDQLRTDYIEAFADLYGDKGFKRLWREGKVYLNGEYAFAGVDRASAAAAIYTGTSPSLNGIVGRNWLDAATLRPVFCVDDPAFMGYYTPDNTSAAQLLTSTIADELKAATGGRALVYAIAPHRESAVPGAGHAGDGAFWINDITGKWCGSTYYGEFPWWVSTYNEKKAADLRIAGITWTPLLPTTKYINLPPEEAKAGFSHKFEDARRNRFKRLMASPYINDEVNLLVEDFLTNSTIGRDDTPDLLALTYHAGSYTESQAATLETQDTYTRLDRSLGNLLDVLDRKVGLANVVLFITSTGYTDDAQALDNPTCRIPGGEFHMNRCTALLNMYLMATYGEGQYIEAHHGTNIFLNHKLIEEKQLELPQVQAKAADFLIQFSGVNDVYSAYRLLLGAPTPEMDKFQKAYHRKRSGDIHIDVLPGWRVMHENGFEGNVMRHAHTPMPIIFMGAGIKPETVHTPIGTHHIAPTIAYIMRIRAPNGCRTKPLTNIR